MGDETRAGLDDHEAPVQRGADGEGAAEVLRGVVVMSVPMGVTMMVAVPMRVIMAMVMPVIMIVVIMIVVMLVVVVPLGFGRVSGVIVRHGISHPTKGGRDQSRPAIVRQGPRPGG